LAITHVGLKKDRTHVYLQYCWHENKHNSNTERVWRIWASNKCRFFIWLVEHNRCWTSDKLAKRGMDHPERCPLCDQQDETINHLLASCVFARQVWTGLLQPAGLLELTLQPHNGVFEDWCTASMWVPGQLRKGFNSLMVLGAWVIWKHRNSCVLNGVSPSVPAVLEMAREEALLWTMARAKGLSMLQAVGAVGV
jgi:hypothetical protein